MMHAVLICDPFLFLISCPFFRIFAEYFCFSKNFASIFFRKEFPDFWEFQQKTEHFSGFGLYRIKPQTSKGSVFHCWVFKPPPWFCLKWDEETTNLNLGSSTFSSTNLVWNIRWSRWMFKWPSADTDATSSSWSKNKRHELIFLLKPAKKHK